MTDTPDEPNDAALAFEQLRVDVADMAVKVDGLSAGFARVEARLPDVAPTMAKLETIIALGDARQRTILDSPLLKTTLAEQTDRGSRLAAQAVAPVQQEITAGLATLGGIVGTAKTQERQQEEISNARLMFGIGGTAAGIVAGALAAALLKAPGPAASSIPGVAAAIVQPAAQPTAKPQTSSEKVATAQKLYSEGDPDTWNELAWRSKFNKADLLALEGCSGGEYAPAFKGSPIQCQFVLAPLPSKPTARR